MFNRILGVFILVFSLAISFFVSNKNTEAVINHENQNAKPNFVIAKAKVIDEVKSLYESIESNGFDLPFYDCFETAYRGYETLLNEGKIKNNKLVLVDFSKSSNTERLWVIDMDSKVILYQSLVAHGRNSGEEFASEFSNLSESFQSSLGFYLTAETYVGKNGFSLRLDGLELGINHKARARAIVIHAADYVSKTFAKDNKRLGRSQGCPALPVELNDEIIHSIKNKACLFIYHPSRKYSTKTVNQL